MLFRLCQLNSTSLYCVNYIIQLCSYIIKGYIPVWQVFIIFCRLVLTFGNNCCIFTSEPSERRDWMSKTDERNFSLQRLKFERLSRNISQKEMANSLGISVNAY